MKAKSKYLYVPIAIVMFIIIGFLVREGTHEQSASDVIWGIYSPILTIFGGIVAIAIIAWFIKRSMRSKSKGDKEVTVSSSTQEEKERPLWLRLTPIILGWIVFVLSIKFLHSQLWNVWYGDQALFWIAQALFVLLLLAFHSHKKIFYILITTAVMLSFWVGFSEELISKGIIKEESVNKFDPLNTTYRLCWEDPRKKKLEPCTPKGERKYGILIVDIKEYHSAMFVFTVSMEELHKRKERGLFRWDKIANSNFGVWHQKGSKRKDHGRWYLKKIGNMFVGWHTGKDGRTYPLTLTPM